jgi:putative membrane protein
MCLKIDYIYGNKYKTMPIISIAFAAIAGGIHVLFFLMESVFWMNPKVHKGFGIKTVAEAEQFKLSFFNQGFYNLFLAIGIFVSIFLLFSGYFIAGKTLLLFCCASMFSASIVLLVSKPNMLRGVFIQGLAPLAALLSWWIWG